MKSISFEINSELTTIEVPDIELYLKLIADNYFAIYYIKELIKNGFVECENLEKIIRINDDTSRETIYELTKTNDYNLSENNCEKPAESTNEDNNEESSMSSNRETQWNVPVTKFLLDKYEIYLNMVGPLKKFKTKKSMWKKIAVEIKEIFGLTYTELQCENRFKTIKKRKTKAVMNNNTSGSSRMPIEYEEEFKKIAAIDDSIQPEVLRGIGKCSTKYSITKNDSGCSSSCSIENISVNEITETVSPQDIQIVRNNRTTDENDNTPRKKKCISDVLLEIHHLKEVEREKRHKEKMGLLKELIDNIKK